MFGGLESVPNNSPHLRKSGSRPVVFDIGESGNSSEEDSLLSKESNEMKGGVTPLSSVGIVPSPLLLWRFKVLLHSSYECVCGTTMGLDRIEYTRISFAIAEVLLFFIWGFCCCKIGWDSVMRMSANLRDLFLYEAFLYYNPLLLVTMMVWLWGMNLWVFAQANVGYAKIFDLDLSHLSHREIWKAITFADFFLADIFTSMSKVFSDLERSVCRMVHRQVATIAWFEADSICGSHSVAIPIVLVLPYIFRLFQCLRQYKDTREKTSLLNVLELNKPRKMPARESAAIEFAYSSSIRRKNRHARDRFDNARIKHARQKFEFNLSFDRVRLGLELDLARVALARTVREPLDSFATLVW
ncbi:spx and exs domain-containing protein 3 [Phtheirospermum japonicum]|uniref:Spx and exs domain-containing protein 3 n=1 Tax=Phtheirospermum japonicum TaxID=374723 RepID=A0A830CF51_9LAMI|nr:spx and exs domain-containing protein 3 [Phtheirospermum japonicum]